MTQNKNHLAVATALCLIFTSGAYAQITLQSQSRSVSANAQLNCPLETPGERPINEIGLSTTDNGVFTESVASSMSGAELNALGGLCTNENEELSSSAMQSTTISGAAIHGSGSAQAGKGGGAGESGSARGRSVLSVRFQVTNAMTYQLFGHVDGIGASTGIFFPAAATVSLKQGNTTIHSVSPNEPDFLGEGTERPFSFAGVLAPGDYTLDARAMASAFGPIEEGFTSSFNLTFVPEPTATPLVFAMIALGTMRFRRASLQITA